MNIQRAIDAECERINEALELFRAYRIARNRERAHVMAVFIRQAQQDLHRLFVQQSKIMSEAAK